MKSLLFFLDLCGWSERADGNGRSTPLAGGSGHAHGGRTGRPASSVENGGDAVDHARLAAAQEGADRDQGRTRGDDDASTPLLGRLGHELTGFKAVEQV